MKIQICSGYNETKGINFDCKYSFNYAPPKLISDY